MGLVYLKIINALLSLCIQEFQYMPMTSANENVGFKTAFFYLASTVQKNGILKPEARIQTYKSGQDIIPYTFSDLEQQCPRWEDEDLAIPHIKYRDVAKDVISAGIRRLSPVMTERTFEPNNLLLVFAEDLESCNTPTELLTKMKEQLGRLLPPITETTVEPKRKIRQRNRKIQEDFFKEANNLLKDDKLLEEDRKIKEKVLEQEVKKLQNLFNHPLFKSMEGRCAIIYLSSQIYRNFRHQLVGLDKCVGLPLICVMDTGHWQTHYDCVVTTKDVRRLDRMPPVFKKEDFPEFGTEMALILNAIRERHLQDSERFSRAGHLVICRHAMQHGNGQHVLGGVSLDREVILKNLCSCYGPVAIDTRDYNRVAWPGVDFSSFYS